MITSLLAACCMAASLSQDPYEPGLFVPEDRFAFGFFPENFDNLSVVVLKAQEKLPTRKFWNHPPNMEAYHPTVHKVEVLNAHPLIPLGNYELVHYFRSLKPDQLYFGIINVSKDNKLELFTNLDISTDTKTVTSRLLLAVNSTEFIKDEHPQHSVLYTYVQKVIESSFEDAKAILDPIDRAPYPYLDSLANLSASEAMKNKLEGPSLWIFNRAKGAPSVKKLMLLTKLYGWKIIGLDEEFIATYLKVKDDPRVAEYVNLRAVYLDFDYNGWPDDFHRELDEFLDLAESTSIMDGKRMVLRTTPYYNTFQAERVRVAKMLTFNDELLNVTVINWLADAEKQPDKKIDRSLTGPERTAQISAFRSFWMTFYNIPPS